MDRSPRWVFCLDGIRVPVAADPRPAGPEGARGGRVPLGELLMEPGLFARLAAGSAGPLLLDLGGLTVRARPDARAAEISLLAGCDVDALAPGPGPLQGRVLQPEVLLGACFAVCAPPGGGPPGPVPFAAVADAAAATGILSAPRRLLGPSD
ncbi:hypothetical protein H696_06079, partial [Fonticula alba]